MKKHFVRFAAFVFLSGGFCAYGGELSYFPIPASQSDASSGIGNANQYTSAVDAGSGADRVINGATLHASPGAGQSIIADNCSVTASSGSLITTGGSTENIQADGTLREVLSDVIYNSDAGDNSQQEIVLNPAGLTPGATYDLRVYIGKGGNGDRQVNLAFVGDGQAPSETGLFNEDDARTSAGQFQDPNQVYVINYRFTWDGNSAPGLTVTQKSGQAPFVLYALTNQPVTAAPIAAAAPPPPPPPAAGRNQDITTGMVTAESDQVGVTSDTFYSNESLNKNGRWISVKKYGRCWQPSNCPSDWRPYWRGSFRHCDDCGWTWICDASEEEWGWATYHYGRWCRVEGIGCGWAWIPGTEWSGAWVSWRSGRTPECSCVGWAPLPPEATCRVGVGVSTWVDRECDIGPDYYTFVDVRDFGSSSYHSCGCLLERRRYVNIVEHTVNITNISYINVNVNVNVHVNIYNGGPDLNWCNQEIRKYGKTEISAIHINHSDDPGHFKGGRFSHVEGNMLAVFSPKVTREKNLKFIPKTLITVPDSKIDHGWNKIKDVKIKNDLKTKIADQTKGETSTTKKAELPKDVVDKIAITQGHGSPSPTVSPAGSPIAGVVTAQKLTGTLATATPGQSPSVSPTAGQSPGVSPSPSASPTRTFPETYKAPLTLKPVSPTASPSATAAGSASPTRTFPETYKAPLTLKSVTPAPSVSPSASPTRTFPETYKAPLTLKSVTPTPSVAAPKGLSLQGQITATPSASPKVIRSVATATPSQSPGQAPGLRAWGATLHASPTTSPAPTIGKAWTYTPTPQPTIMSTPKSTPIKTATQSGSIIPKGTVVPVRTPTPAATSTPKVIRTLPSREKDQSTPVPSPRATLAPKIKVETTATPQQLHNQRLSDDQLGQKNLHLQDATAGKANAAADAAAAAARANAAAKANRKPAATATPTPGYLKNPQQP